MFFFVSFMLVLVALIAWVLWSWLFGPYLPYEKRRLAREYALWLERRYPQEGVQRAAWLRYGEITIDRFELSKAHRRELLYNEWVRDGLHQQ